MRRFNRIIRTLLISLAMLASCIIPMFGNAFVSVSAISTDYPVPLFNIAVKDNSKVLTETGTDDNSSLSVKALGNNLAPSWRLDRVGADSKGTFFKLINAQSGRLLTPKSYKVSAGTGVVVYGSESAQSQHWYIVPIKQDHLGNDLYYKIVNYSDTNLALTQSSSGITLETYSGKDSQMWLLNADGLQGFAGYCKDDNTKNIKAGTVGGLFGEVVEVSNFNDLKKYATSDTPYTIVVTKDIKVTNLEKDSSGRYYCPDGRIYVHSDKTIVGSYSAHTLFNVQFCTSSGKGVGNNLIIKNFDIQHDAESNGNDSIQVYFGSGHNLWVDHCTFTGHSDYNTASTGLPDWDKFLACCYDADYCTVSDSSFGLHEYGLILGYPDDTQDSYNKYNNYPRMTLASNKFYKTLTRGPGLMRYGYYHSLNNYVNDFSMAYTVHSASKIFAESCRYENGGNVICDWNEVTYPGSYAETGSTSSNCKRTTIEGSAQNCTWRPNTNYDYVSLTSENAKTYCSNYSGCQKSNGNMMYLRFSKNGVPSAGYTEVPSGSSTPVPASFNDGTAYRIKNVNSGLYMQVANAAAENGANVQQWGTDGSSVHDIWKLYNAGDGYYYIASCIGDGGTYVLDIAGKKTENGTNIDIYKYNGGTNQQFMIGDNGDGTYKILTRITGEASTVEVAGASKDAGANIQQWESNGVNCQDWIFEPVTDPGTSMDTSFVYTFSNVNSGLVMEIQNAEMKDNSNVQQWGVNGHDCQKWILKEFGSGNYYWIRSQLDNDFAMKAEGSTNGGNIDITAYSSKDSTQLFRFTKNLDGSYSIISHASKDTCLVEAAGASKDAGANIQQWEPTNSPCQKWNIQTETKPATTTTTTTTTTTAATTTTTASTTVTIPTTTTDFIPEKLIGDINGDGVISVLDIVLLQKWIAAVPNTPMPDAEASDIDGNGRIDIFDLCMLKEELVK